jgi:hypothetical protein
MGRRKKNKKKTESMKLVGKPEDHDLAGRIILKWIL